MVTQKMKMPLSRILTPMIVMPHHLGMMNFVNTYELLGGSAGIGIFGFGQSRAIYC